MSRSSLYERYATEAKHLHGLCVGTHDGANPNHWSGRRKKEKGRVVIEMVIFALNVSMPWS